MTGTPTKVGRLSLLDGLRGYFLVFMMINHVNFQDGALIVRINHAELGFVQDAQGFVFLSGLLVGLYYTRLYRSGRGMEAARRILRRAVELYRYVLVILGAAVLLAVAMPELQDVWGDWLGGIYGDTLAHGASAALLLYQPTYMDILPQYIIYLLVSPLLIPLVLAGRWRVVAAGSAALWLAVQFGAHLPFTAGLEHALRAASPDLALRSHFNPLAWQVVFVSGLLLGAAKSAGTLDLDRWFSPRDTFLPLCALGLVLFFMAWQLGFSFGLVPDVMAERFWPYANRSDFGLVYLVNFTALAYLMTWLLRCGPEAGDAAIRTLSGLLRRLFTLPFLTLLGRHSLQVYAFHVILVYALVTLEWRYGALGEVQKTTIILLSIASLALPAIARERLARQQGGPIGPSHRAG